MKTVAFFNNKGGVGKTSLVYHLAWMYADLGLSVVAADLDPQANLTSMFVDDEQLEEFWPDGAHDQTLYGAIQPLLEGTGDVRPPHVEEVAPGLGLVIGDLLLSAAEDELSSQWPDSLDRKPRAFRVLSALWRVMKLAATELHADLVLVDVGPNLGALKSGRSRFVRSRRHPARARSLLTAGIENLGPTLRRWRTEWGERLDRNPAADLDLPSGRMEPAGYVVMQHAVRLDRPVKAYEKWIARIPAVYHDAVLGEPPPAPTSVQSDAHCLAMLKHFRSLMPLAQESRKPMFFLKPADGAIGGHAKAAQDCYFEFRALARGIAGRCNVALPPLTAP